MGNLARDMSGDRPSLAFVVPSAGEDALGAEDELCLQLARHLAPYADIEVLTTCALDDATWRNHYQRGHTIVGDVHVNRFRVDASRGRSASLGPFSTELRSYIYAHERRFNGFAFFGYQNASTYFTLPLVQEKALLWPLARDRWPDDLSAWSEFFQRPRQLVFGSTEEQHSFAARFPHATTPGTVVAPGAVAPAAGNAARFRDRYGVHGPFVLFIGRLEPDSGCSTLFEYFAKYQSTATVQRRLVVIGDGPLAVPSDPAIVALGNVKEGSKWDALAAAELVVIPSPLDNTSPALPEAWVFGKPIVVNAAASALVEECRRANAGLWYSDSDEFSAALDLLTPQLALRLGEQGQRYAESHSGWEEAVKAYRRILNC